MFGNCSASSNTVKFSAQAVPTVVLLEAPPRTGLTPGCCARVHSLTLPDMSNMSFTPVLSAKHAASDPVAKTSSYAGLVPVHVPPPVHTAAALAVVQAAPTAV